MAVSKHRTQEISDRNRRALALLDVNWTLEEVAQFFGISRQAIQQSLTNEYGKDYLDYCPNRDTSEILSRAGKVGRQKVRENARAQRDKLWETHGAVISSMAKEKRGITVIAEATGLSYSLVKTLMIEHDVGRTWFPKVHSDDDIIRTVIGCYNESGRPITSSSYREYANRVDGPRYSTVEYRMGLPEACRRAGVPYAIRENADRRIDFIEADECLVWAARFFRWCDENEQPNRLSDYVEWRKDHPGSPGHSIMARRLAVFEGWRGIRREWDRAGSLDAFLDTESRVD